MTSNQTRILIVEDEPKVLSFIKQGLEENGYDVTTAMDGTEGLKKAQESPFDIIILDLMIPGIHGIEVCRALQKLTNRPKILMLTALGTLSDKLLGFDAGADDYLVKPFEFPELLARIRSLCRREAEVNNPQVLQAADLILDRNRKIVKRREKTIELTAKEYLLLEFLLLNKGKVVSKADITQNVWDIRFNTGTNVVEVYINFLRKKIDKDIEPKLIHTIIGMGYILKDD